MSKIAIIDVGSRSVVLEIFEIRGESFKVLRHDSHKTFLGKNMGHDGLMDAGAVKNTLDVIREYKNIIDNQGRVHVYVGCTAAVRNSKYKDEFTEQIQDILGPNAEISVIDGKKEAYYDYLGVINTTDMREFVLIDTGGSSTEIALIKDRRLIDSVSLPHGAVNLTERFFPSVRAAAHTISEAENTIRPDIENIPWISEAKNLPIIACGGSVRALARAEMGKRLATNSSLHNYMINYSNFNFMYRQIGKLDADERQKKLGINRKSAKVILGGLVPLKILFDVVQARRVYYSEYALRYGMFYEKFARANNRLTPVEPDVLEASVARLQQRFECDVEHATKVRELALSVFDQTEKWHRLGERYRKILAVAASLHDCGEFIQFHNHQQHSYYLIRESDIYGMDKWDKLFAAVVAGMHRREKLQFDRKKYRKVLNLMTYGWLKELAVCLAVGEKIANGDNDNVKVKVGVESKAIRVNVEVEQSARGRQATVHSTPTQVTMDRKMMGRKVILLGL
jgi:exopolyphosphatase/guanosine-5'-triphosphate,3'-diphosphate pyrophosphatase